MDELIKVIILGIVEGVTEFLPISSTGHLLVTSTLVDLSENLRGTFEIFIQIGAVFAVIAYYWTDLFGQLRTVRSDRNVQRLWFGVLVAFIPAVIFGLLLDDAIDSLFGDVVVGAVVVALALIVGGVMFIVVERWQMHSATSDEAADNAADDASEPARDASQLQAVTIRQALTIGIWQLLALIPGMSRSGMSIIGGMLAGLDRKTATEFSFYLAIPTLGGATVYAFLRDLDQITTDGLLLLFIGAAISGVVAWLSIRWLLNFIASNSFVIFGYYRVIIGCMILVLVALQIIA